MNRLPRFSSRRQLIVWATAIGLLLTALVLFLALAAEVQRNGATSWDAAVMLRLHTLSAPWLDKIMRAVTNSAGVAAIVPLLAAVTWFWRRQERATALLFLASYAGSGLLNRLLKALFARPRPMLFEPLVVVTSYSFPSGHAMTAGAVYGLAALILWQRGRTGWAVLAGLWVPLVAVSRVYLGVHYPSDVLAALAVVAFWLLAVWITFAGQHPLRTDHRRGE